MDYHSRWAVQVSIHRRALDVILNFNILQLPISKFIILQMIFFDQSAQAFGSHQLFTVNKHSSEVQDATMYKSNFKLRNVSTNFAILDYFEAFIL